MMISFRQHISEWLKSCIDITPINNKPTTRWHNIKN
jgi:hypothetical protein